MAATSNLVAFVDIETAAGTYSEIVQIAARCNNQTYDAYISISGEIQYECTQKHGISKINGRLVKNGSYLPTKNYNTALDEFIQFLDRCGGPNQVYLTAYNGRSLDFPTLYREIRRLNLHDKFQRVVAGSTDILDVFKQKGVYTGLIPSMSSLASRYGVQATVSHDALHDAAVLQTLCSKLNVQVDDITRYAQKY